MGLFSFFRKSKQEPASGTSEFYSRAEEESNAVRGRGKRKQSNKANEPVDPVLPEKKRARRRLVGAVALVLAAIIGLPMILDSEPKPLADDIAIQIPSKDKPFQPNASRPMTPPPAVGGKVSASAGLDKNEEVIEPSSIGATPAKENPNPPPTANTSSKPEQAQPSGKPEFKAIPQTQPAAKADDAARARAILEGKPDGKAEKAKAAEIKPNKFIVQVAALASQGKVNELQGKLKSAGIKSYTQKVATQTGERIRIRVGPFASKEEADKMRAKLGKIGLNGTLVPA
jgi:DedD protein